MSTIASALGASGAGATLVHEGKTYTCGYLTQANKAKFEKWIQSRAIGVLTQLRQALPEEEYEREKAHLLDEVKTGAYSFHGQLAAQALATPTGALAMAAILFGIDEGEMVSVMLAHPEESRAILDHSLAESAPRPRPQREGAEGNVPAA